MIALPRGNFLSATLQGSPPPELKSKKRDTL